LEYLEVEADQGRMAPLMLPAMFDFFDRQRKKQVELTDAESISNDLISALEWDCPVALESP
jgi:hypothetical protein